MSGSEKPEFFVNLCSREIMFRHSSMSVSRIPAHPTPIKVVWHGGGPLKHHSTLEMGEHIRWPLYHYRKRPTIEMPPDLPEKTTAIIVEPEMAEVLYDGGDFRQFPFRVFVISPDPNETERWTVSRFLIMD